MFCSKCGTKAIDGAAFCQKCGAKLIQGNMDEQEPIQDLIQESTKIPILSVNTASKKGRKLFKFAMSGILILIGVLILLFGVIKIDLGNIGAGSAVVFDDENSDDIYNPDRVESVSLTQTYINEEEGFSFMYPYDWDIENAEEVFPDALMSVACTGMLGTYARIAVMKAVDDGALYALNRSDFKEVFSFGPGVSGVKVMDLSDINLDGCPARKLAISGNVDGDRIVCIHYFYIRDSYIYDVVCAVAEDDYERYEPIFDAIMDSYIITTADKSGENKDKIYINEEEGLSFMYPGNWDLENDSDSDVLVYIACTGMFTYAWIDVEKYVDDGFEFAATRSDFEAIYSSELGVSDVKVMNLSDINLDGCPARKLAISGNVDGGRVVWIHYFYIRDSYIYFVTCGVDEFAYEIYEPIFDAIMDSYTITAADKFGENEDMGWAYEDIWGWEGDDENYPALGYGLEWVETPYVTTDIQGYSIINGVIENISESSKSLVIITFNLYDVNGYQIDYAIDSIQNLRSGGKWKFSATTWNKDVAYWEFADITVY